VERAGNDAGVLAVGVRADVDDQRAAAGGGVRLDRREADDPRPRRGEQLVDRRPHRGMISAAGPPLPPACTSRRATYDPSMRERPNRLERLPQQYFAQLLGRVSAAAAKEGPPVIDLGRGNPEVGPPEHVVAALRDAADAPSVHGYAPFRGLPRLRQAIARRYRDVYDVELDPEREVAVVPGTKTAIVELAAVLAEDGQTVLLPDPYYPDYPSGVALAGADLGLVSLDPAAGWAPDFDRAPSAAALYLNYPSNPCAVCAAPGLFAAAVEYAHRTGTAIVHDAAYLDLVHDGRRPESFLATPGAKDAGVEMFSMSKTYGMAGWRIGFVVGNAEIVERVNTLSDHTRVGIFAALQEAAIAALEGPQDSVEARRATYERRRDTLAAALPEPPVCEGTFYVWLRLPEGLTPDRILAEQRVAVAPGEGFGPTGAGWARLSLAVSDETLADGIERLAPALAAAYA
jgi:L-glutamine---4-(methylsulfanyl)-2-oxobutanoate aminotransferase